LVRSDLRSSRDPSTAAADPAPPTGANVDFIGPLLFAVGSIMAVAGMLFKGGVEFALGGLMVMAALRRAVAPKMYGAPPVERQEARTKDGCALHRTHADSFRHDAWPGSPLRAGLTEASMGIMYVIGGCISAGLFVYLVFAMLTPEKFS
jgi:K+-transporting ATPase KdpF subunit